VKALRHSQHGLSLVELMVALVLGMVLIAGFLQIFMSVRSTYATNEGASRVQENGRFALDYLARHARMAGYSDPKNTDRPRPIVPTATSCDLGGNSDNFCTLHRALDTTAATGAEVGSQISFEYQPTLIESSSSRFDCKGSEFSSEKTIITTFTTKVGENSSALAVRCMSADGNSTSVNSKSLEELVDGIDAFHIQYGLAPTGSITQYVTANDVNNWSEVAALRIAVLANSVTPVTPAPPANKEYYLLETGPFTFDDGKMRQVFTTTVYLRNSVQ